MIGQEQKATTMNRGAALGGRGGGMGGQIQDSSEGPQRENECEKGPALQASE